MQVPNDGMIRRVTTVATPVQRTNKRNFKTLVHGSKPKTSSVPLVASIGGVCRTVGSLDALAIEGRSLVGLLRFNSDSNGSAIRDKYSFGNSTPRVSLQGAAARIEFN